LDRGNLFVDEQNGSVGELTLRGLGVRHEVGRNVATVPLEALNILYLGLESFAL
jgi:hypothetical protein